MTVIALLPMKLHSSRVPGKNFRRIGSKPLFRWTLDRLLALEFIDHVVINTDAAEMLAEKGLPESGKLIIKERPKVICGDEVSMNLILADDMKDYPADHYLMTHTTNPLLSEESIAKAWSEYESAQDRGDCDSMFAVNKHQTRFYRENCTPVNHDPNNLIPTQDLEPWYEENSCLYFFSKKSFESTGARIGANPMLFETPKIESVDIDEPEDWEMAEALIKVRS